MNKQKTEWWDNSEPSIRETVKSMESNCREPDSLGWEGEFRRNGKKEQDLKWGGGSIFPSEP